MENKQVAEPARPDPEVQAGRALRRLRQTQGWSQEEVAKRMQAYGYDFHQTMIAKIEAAQRPLRVRELADFAALYGVQVHELIYSRNGSLAEIDQEVAEVQSHLMRAKVHADQAARQLHHAEAEYAMCSRETETLSMRLGFLMQERAKIALWEADEEPDSSHGPRPDARPDPLTASTAAEFITALRTYRERAGNPSFRSMATQAEEGRVSTSTMWRALRGDALPTLDVVKAIIAGCHGNEDDLQDFVTAWHRIATDRAEARPVEPPTLAAAQAETTHTPHSVGTLP